MFLRDKIERFICLVAAAPTAVDQTESVALSDRCARRHRSIVVALEGTHWSTDWQRRLCRTAPHVNKNKRNNSNDSKTRTGNDSSGHVVGKEARSAVTIADAAAIKNTRTKRNAVAVQAGLIKPLVVWKQAEAALVDNARTERHASAVQARSTITVADTAAIDSSVAKRNAKAVEASRVAHRAIRSPADTTGIRRPTRVGNAVASCATLPKRKIKRILASATAVDKEAAVGHTPAISAQLIKHRSLGLHHGMQAVTASVNLATTVGSAGAISAFLVKLGIAERQAVATLVVAEVGEGHSVATQARLSVATANTADVKHKTAVGVTVATSARIVTSRVACIQAVATRIKGGVSKGHALAVGTQAVKQVCIRHRAEAVATRIKDLTRQRHTIAASTLGAVAATDTAFILDHTAVGNAHAVGTRLTVATADATRIKLYEQSELV